MSDVVDGSLDAFGSQNEESIYESDFNLMNKAIKLYFITLLICIGTIYIYRCNYVAFDAIMP